MIPLKANHPQLCAVASRGKNVPLVIRVKIPRKKNAINNRKKLTAREPIFLLADSKAKAVTVQKNAVNRAANSPKCGNVITYKSNNNSLVIAIFAKQADAYVI